MPGSICLSMQPYNKQATLSSSVVRCYACDQSHQCRLICQSVPADAMVFCRGLLCRCPFTSSMLVHKRRLCRVEAAERVSGVSLASADRAQSLQATAAYLQHSACAPLLESVQSPKLVLETSVPDGINGVVHEGVSQVYWTLCTSAVQYSCQMLCRRGRAWRNLPACMSGVSRASGIIVTDNT